MTTIDLLFRKNITIKALALFLDPKEYTKIEENTFPEFREKLYMKLGIGINSYDIKENKYQKILELKGFDKVPNAHTPIEGNTNTVGS
jgi:hypothetical protein